MNKSSGPAIISGNGYKLPLFFFLFGISGFAGLIYESIWTHYLKLFLGHAAYAQTLVLSIFMGGMALGSWITGLYSHRISNLLRGYALVEGVIGIFAVCFHPVFTGSISILYSSVFPYLNNPIAVNFFKWGLAIALILPQTVFLGATFPLMCGGIIRAFPDSMGRSIATLYFTNSLGAAIGVLASGFILIDMVGLPGTILTAGVINIILSLMLWFLGDKVDQSKSVNGYFTDQPVSVMPNQALVRLLLICSALTGASSFLYEIGWIRMLSMVLGSSTHAFELMLSAFILGLAIGGFTIRNRMEYIVNHLKILAWVQIIMGVMAFLTLLTYGRQFHLMNFFYHGLGKTPQGYILFNIISHGIALSIMLPATICAGMTLPLITHYLLTKGEGERVIGKVYALNTFGSIAGVIIGVQFILPNMGLRHLITIGGGIDILLGVVLLFSAGSMIVGQKTRILTAALSFLFVLTGFLFFYLNPQEMASGVFRFGDIDYNRKILFHKDGKTATISVNIPNKNVISLATNGKPDASINITGGYTMDEVTQTLVAALPIAVRPNSTRAAAVGVGSGMTSHVLLLNPGFSHVDTIEIEPAMIEAAKIVGKKSERVFTDLRSHIYVEDAKTYFTNMNITYDIIISEPSNPWVSGIANLFSREFYSLVKNYLKTDGIFVQWLPLYEFNIDLFSSVMLAIAEQFSDYVIYLSNENDLIIIATPKGRIPDPSDAIFRIPQLSMKLNQVGINSIHDIAIRKLGSGKWMNSLFNSYKVPVNSDFFPFLDNNAGRARYLEQYIKDITNFRWFPGPFIAIMEDSSFPDSNLNVSDTPIATFTFARQAMAISDYFRHKKHENQKLVPNAKYLAMIRQLTSINYQCNPEETEKIVLPILHEFARTILPYLSPEENKIIWNDIESIECYSLLSEHLRLWLSLYKMVGMRDFEKMGQYSKRLLFESKVSNTSDNKYLVIISMLSDITASRYSSVLELSRRCASGDSVPIEIRALTAFANEQLKHKSIPNLNKDVLSK